jgi:oligoendopeptidase F
MFAEFEKVMHAIEEAGDALTLDTFKGEYTKLLEAYFGGAVVLDPQLSLECLRIPHFFSAFYVYKYATGISAAVQLSEKVLEQEPGAVEKYLGFLKSGGSKFPLETLKAAGVDMLSPGPVESTLELFGRRLGELEQLLISA